MPLERFPLCCFPLVIMHNTNPINYRPLQTITNLLNTFPVQPPLRKSQGERTIPLGIEIEVPWRAYYPDLWIEGFPNVDPVVLDRISQECTLREKELLPNLVLAQQCGIPSGADKYWEFAFDPVTDVSILINQLDILKANKLMPQGKHSLHITIGGIKPTVDMYYVAMILEAFACDTNRIKSAFSITNTSKGWARKGRAGLFEKQGSHDLQHGYEYGVEIRMLCTPDTSEKMFLLLNDAQSLSELVSDPSSQLPTSSWHKLKKQLMSILIYYELPASNWNRPSENQTLWNHIANVYPELSRDVRSAACTSGLISSV
jgi:hypothetical protein